MTSDLPNCRFCGSAKTIPGAFIDGKCVALTCVTCGARLDVPTSTPSTKETHHAS